MSVINQMLRDLDKRQAVDPSLARLPVVPVPGRRGWLWWLLLLPALWLGVEIGQQWRVPAAQQVTDSQAQNMQPSASAPVPAEPKPATKEIQDHSTLSAKTSGNSAAAQKNAVAEPTAAPQDASEQSNAAKTNGVAEVGNTRVEPVVTEAVLTPTAAEPERDTQAYALDEQDADFLTEPSLETPAAVKPQMTVTKADPERSAQQHWRSQAQQAQAAGRFADAEAAWLQLLQLQPQQTEAYEQLAQLYLQQKNWANLTPLLQRSRQHQLESIVLQWAQVQNLAGTQQWQALLDALTPALQQQYPQQVLALEAHAAQQTGQSDRAFSAYQRWTQLTPQDSRAWLGLGMMLDQRGAWPEARQAYQQALQWGGLTDASRQFIQQRFAAGTGQ